MNYWSFNWAPSIEELGYIHILPFGIKKMIYHFNKGTFLKLVNLKIQGTNPKDVILE